MRYEDLQLGTTFQLWHPCLGSWALVSVAGLANDGWICRIFGGGYTVVTETSIIRACDEMDPRTADTEPMLPAITEDDLPSADAAALATTKRLAPPQSPPSREKPLERLPVPLSAMAGAMLIGLLLGLAAGLVIGVHIGHTLAKQQTQHLGQ